MRLSDINIICESSQFSKYQHAHVSNSVEFYHTARGIHPRTWEGRHHPVGGLADDSRDMTMDVLVAAEDVFERESGMREDLRRSISVKAAYDKYGSLELKHPSGSGTFLLLPFQVSVLCGII